MENPSQARSFYFVLTLCPYRGSSPEITLESRTVWPRHLDLDSKKNTRVHQESSQTGYERSAEADTGVDPNAVSRASNR